MGGAPASTPATVCKPTASAMPKRIERKATNASINRAPPDTRFFWASSASPVVRVIPGTSEMTPLKTTTSRETSGRMWPKPQARSAAMSPPTKSTKNLPDGLRLTRRPTNATKTPVIAPIPISRSPPRKKTAAAAESDADAIHFAIGG